MNADEYGDSDFLAQRDKTINDFRESDKDTKRKIIGKMLTLRHNMKYNKHLLSVYMKAKSLFDTMIEEHRSQLHYLDEIYRHLNHIIRENLSEQKNRNSKNAGTNPMMAELLKDKKRIGILLKKMRDSFNKLMDIDTVIGVTIAQINEITFMEDHDEEGEGDESEGDESEGDSTVEDDGEDASEDDSEDASEDESEDDGDEDDSEDEEAGEDDDEDDEEDDEEDDGEDEEDDDGEDDESEDDEEAGEDDEEDEEADESDDEDEEDVSEDDGETGEDDLPNSIYLF
jgi:hypothetical protein